MNWNERFRSMENESSFGADESTLRLGSSGAEVKKWQAIIGVTQDGSFGPATDAATRAWQKSHKLVVDGVVGPATWSIAFPRKVSELPPTLDPNDIHAKVKAATTAIGLTPNESLFLRAVSYHETKFGLGWGSTPPPNGGAGSYNMGANTTGGSQTSQYDFEHKDSRNDDGKIITYSTWFKGYPSLQDGVAGLAKVLLKTNVKQALEKGDFQAAVKAMYTNRYYLGIHPRNTADGNAANVKDYWTAVQKALAVIKQKTGDIPKTSILTGLKMIIGLALGAGLWYGYGKVKGG